jgi:zinc/manganese transport system substrate-binding protein/manganese/iron transport system substrate-binding protein
VDVYDMIKPNVDPHDFESSPADLVALAEAKVVVRNGAGLEPWLDDAIDSSDFGGTVVDTSSRVPLRRTDGSEIPPGQLTADDARSGAVDPHIWQDPRNAELMVAAMRDAFVAADPRDAGVFRSDTVRYLAVLAALDARVARSIATLPATNRTVVTNHDAFDYYLRRYGLTFVGSIIPSFDTSAELSGKSLDDLVARIRAQHVRAVFSETSLPPRTAQTVAREAGVRVVAGAGSLYGDTLGLPGSPGDTYVHMIDHNTTTFVTALR